MDFPTLCCDGQSGTTLHLHAGDAEGIGICIWPGVCLAILWSFVSSQSEHSRNATSFRVLVTWAVCKVYNTTGFVFLTPHNWEICFECVFPSGSFPNPVAVWANLPLTYTWSLDSSKGRWADVHLLPEINNLWNLESQSRGNEAASQKEGRGERFDTKNTVENLSKMEPSTWAK